MPKRKSALKRATNTKRTRAGQTKKASSKSPYETYRQRPLWTVIDRSLEELASNQDIRELTPRRYIVGYICKKLLNSKTIRIAKP